MKKALVVVLGDIARSPRMQYHCISLAKHDFQVTVIATGKDPKRDLAHDEVETNPNIKLSLMKDAPDFRKYLSISFLALPLKALWQAFLLIYHLYIISAPHVIVVQNPPSVPTLPILWLYSRIVSSKFIIDWHNYGFTILSLSVKPTHPLVKIMTFIEIFFGRLANAGFTVTAAMKEDLETNYHIKYPLYVLYDKPPEHFKPLRLKERHKFFLKMKDTIPAFQPKFDGQDEKSYLQETRFTTTDVIQRPDRPVIIFSSTSWTEDEDFGLLLSALKQYDTMREEDESASLPKLVCVITGKGPLKSFWESKIPSYNFKHIDFELPWLSCADYPKMVACSDIGISLHRSSSGVDLPMKVVDMFGCGVPVLAYYYPAIKELVVDDKYGLTFIDANDFVDKLLLLVENFYVEDSCSREFVNYSCLGRYKKNIKRHFLLTRWEENWKRNVAHIFSDTD